MTLLRIIWERIQYNAVLAITATIRGTVRDKVFKELRVRALQSRRRLNQLCTFKKIKTASLPPYLFKATQDI